MASINVQNSDAILESLATHILEAHGKTIGNAIINKNFILAYLNDKGKVIEVGGLDFAEPVLMSENSNFAYRSHYSQIDANIQDPFREFKFEPKTLDGTIVLNTKHKLMNKGRAQIKNLMKSLRMQADSTIKNVINKGVWASSPTSDEPESLVTLISATPTSGSIGGQSRSGNTWAQNKADTTTVSDIGSEAGLSALHKFRITLGGDAKTSPDFGVTTATLYAGLMAYIDSTRRLRANEKMAKLGLDTFYLGSATIGYDGDGGTGECPEGYFYFLNSNHLFYKILEGGNMVFEPFSRKGNSLNSTSIFYHFHNLTTNLPPAMGVHTNISST